MPPLGRVSYNDNFMRLAASLKGVSIKMGFRSFYIIELAKGIYEVILFDF